MQSADFVVGMLPFSFSFYEASFDEVLISPRGFLSPVTSEEKGNIVSETPNQICPLKVRVLDRTILIHIIISL